MDGHAAREPGCADRRGLKTSAQAEAARRVLTFELTGRGLAHAMPEQLKALRLDELLYMERKMRERNDEITKRALRGEKMTELAKEFGVSSPRIRQIVARVCKRQNKQWFKAMPSFKEDENNAWGFDLQWARDHRRVFFDDV